MRNAPVNCHLYDFYTTMEIIEIILSGTYRHHFCNTNTGISKDFQYQQRIPNMITNIPPGSPIARVGLPPLSTNKSTVMTLHGCCWLSLIEIEDMGCLPYCYNFTAVWWNLQISSKNCAIFVLSWAWFHAWITEH